MTRLFVGVPVSDEIKERIKPLFDELNEIGADLNLVSLENLHFTIKFLGDVNEEKTEEIKDKLSEVVKIFFTVKLKQVGTFPSLQRINVIWIGTDSQELVSLMKEVDEKLDYIKKNDFEQEVAHLTIARVKSGKNKLELQEFVKKFEQEEFGEMIINKMILYESELTPAGPKYKVVKEFYLQ